MSSFRKKICVALFAAVLASAAPKNSVWLRGGEQSLNGQPVTISRFFAQGEIARCAQAVIDGQALPTQCDEKTRWPDGSLQHALLTFAADVPAGGSVEVSFHDQQAPGTDGALGAEQMLAFADGSWGARIEASTEAGRHGVDAREMLRAGQFRYWMKGPLATQVIVEGRRDAPETLFAYDFGWRCTENCAGQGYANASWEDVTGSGKAPMHPIFVLTFYTGRPGVKVEFILENQWADKLADQRYDLRLVGGQEETLFEMPGLVQASKTRWRKVFWSGAAPAGWKSEAEPGLVVDHNLPYLTYSRAIPNYDSSLKVSDAAVRAELREFQSRVVDGEPQFCRSVTFCGQWWRYFGTAGARGELAVLPRWYLKYLYTSDPSLYGVMVGNALASGAMPIHVRESRTDRTFLKDAPLSALGLPLSIEARPTVRAFTETGQTRPDDRLGFTSTVQCLEQSSFGCTSFAPGAQRTPETVADWKVDLSHQPSINYVPYLVTGDYYFLEEMYFWASYNAAYYIPSARCGDYCRGNEWGFLHSPGGIRAEAWGLRNIAHAAMMAPAGTPEKAYYTRILENNIAIREGYFDIRDGAFFEPNPGGTAEDPCPAAGYNPERSTRWCWGRVTIGRRANNPLRFAHFGMTGWSGITATKVGSGDSIWMNNFYRVALGHIGELGFPVERIRQEFNRPLINQVLDSQYNPYLASEYMFAVRREDGSFIDNWKEIRERFIVTTRLRSPLAAEEKQYVDIADINGGVQGNIRIDTAQHLRIGDEIVRVCGSSLLRDGAAYVGTRLSLCGNGRGAQGTAISAHAEGAEVSRLMNEFPTIMVTNYEGGYAHVTRAALSYAVDLTSLDSDGVTPLAGRAAYEKYSELVAPWTAGLNDNPMWAIVPRTNEELARLPLARDPARPARRPVKSVHTTAKPAVSKVKAGQ